MACDDSSCRPTVIVLTVVGGAVRRVRGSYSETALATNSATPGTELAHAISETTGVGTSPLLGVKRGRRVKILSRPDSRSNALACPVRAAVLWIPRLCAGHRLFSQGHGRHSGAQTVEEAARRSRCDRTQGQRADRHGAFVPLIVAVFRPAEPETSLSGASGFRRRLTLRGWVTACWCRLRCSPS